MRSLLRHPFFSTHQLLPLAVIAAFLFAGVISGVVVGSGNVVLIALTVGLVVGVVLLSAVPAVVWIVLFGALVLTGPLLLFVPQLNRLPWLFALLGFFLSGAAVLYAGTERRIDRIPVPGFITLAVMFIVYSVFMLLLSEGRLEVGLSAIKRQFQFWGLFFALAVVPINKSTIYRWGTFLVCVAAIQLPFALYQYIKLVPMRLNMPNRVVPIDIVAGTFEADLMGGGNSNVMALLLVVGLVGVMAMRRDRVISLPWTVALLILIGLPLGLGETKLALVMLPVALLAVFGDLVKKRPALFAGGAAAAVVGLAALTYVYVGVQSVDDRPMTFQQRLDENLAYNFGEAGYYAGASLNRSTVVPFWFSRHGLNNPIETIFGHGLGASFGAPGTESSGHLQVTYPGYAIGLTGISSMLWDVGIVGTFMYLGILGLAWMAALQLTRRAAPGRDRAMMRTMLAGISVLFPFFIAVDQMLSAPSMQVLMGIALGIVAWRWRQQEAT